MSGSCSDPDLIFDACLKVDGLGDPSTAPRSEKLPANIIFSDGNPNAPYVYREILVAPVNDGYDYCTSQPGTKKRRAIR